MAELDARNPRDSQYDRATRRRGRLQLAILGPCLCVALALGLEPVAARGEICADQRGENDICPFQQLKIGGKPVGIELAHLGSAVNTIQPQIVIGRKKGNARVYGPRFIPELDYGNAGTLDADLDVLQAIAAFESGRPRPPTSPIRPGISVFDEVAMVGQRDGRGVLAVFDDVGSPTQTFDLGTETGGASVTAGDLDRNGFLDVVVSIPLRREIRVFSAVAAGQFVAGSVTRVGTRRIASIRVRDFDGDGQRDLAGLASRPDRVLLLPGDRSGGFAPSRIAYDASELGGVSGFADGDTDNDDEVDDLVLGGANDVVALAWDETAVAQPTISSGVGGLGPLAVQEISGDGIEDVVGATGEILLNTGQGDFELAGGQLAREVIERAPLAPVFGRLDEDAADVAEDSRTAELLDAILVTPNQRLALYISDPVQVQGPPRAGERLRARPIAGAVLVTPPGQLVPRPLEREEALPVDTLFDTSNGEVRITVDSSPGQESILFRNSVFVARQRAGTDNGVVADLGGDLACPTSDRARGSAFLTALAKKDRDRRKQTRKQRKRLRKKLSAKGMGSTSGSGGRGTAGRVSNAKGAETEWDTVETCEGTKFIVKKGVLEVTDFSDGQTRVLRGAGSSYFARVRE